MAGERWDQESLWIYNNLTMNDKRVFDSYIIRGVTGFRSATIREQREDVTSGDGQQLVGETFFGGKVITLRGFIRAGNLETLRTMEDDLYTATMSRVELPLKVQARTGYPKTITAVQIGAKLTTAPDMDTEIKGVGKYETPFQLIFGATNPRIVAQAEQTAFGVVAPGGTFVDVVVNNAGKFPAQARYQITGPTGNAPSVRRTDAAGATEFTYVIGSLSTNEFLTFDTVTKKVTGIAQGSNQNLPRRSMMSGLSKWITLNPGNNTIRLFASAGARIDVWWRNTWL